jgi:hypothetical protein
VKLLKEKKEKLIQVYTWWFKPGRQYGRKKKKEDVYKYKYVIVN